MFHSLAAVCLAAVVGFSAGHAEAEDGAANSAQAITGVVRLQLEAFADDDAEKAFSLSTETTRNLAGTPNEFMQVIRRKFTPIYRHRQAFFSEPEIIGPHALQVVQLIDHDNLIWIAIYQVEQETDGAWRIDGCQLFETDDMSI